MTGDRPGPRRVRALTAHEIPDRAPLALRVGDEVVAGERSDEWPEFVFVEAAAGRGWVPARHLSSPAGSATVEVAYDTTELPTDEGQVLEVLEEDLRSGWIRCRAEGGAEGWVPVSTLAPADD